MPYDSERDFAPVIQLLQVPFVLIVNPELVPMRTLPELISHAKANPGWLTAATLGPGSPHETAMSWFKSTTGIDLLLVPYRGGNLAMTDLLGGQVKAMMSGVAAAEEIIKSGKAFPIAVASRERLSSMPNVPTIAEQGYPEYTFASWFGVVAPGKTPPNVIQQLNSEINRALETKSVRDRIVTAGGEVVGGPPARMKETIIETNARYAQDFRGNRHQAGLIRQRRIPHGPSSHIARASDGRRRRNACSDRSRAGAGYPEACGRRAE